MFPRRNAAASHLFTIYSLGYYGCAPNIGWSLGSGAFPTSNKIFYIPFRIPTEIIVQQLFSLNGATVSGNIDVGIYSIDGTRLTNSGSTAQAGTSAKQLYNITDLILARGTYYFGVTLDNITGTLQRSAVAASIQRMYGVLQEAAGSFGLPATATFATQANAYLPLVGLLAQSVM